MKKPFSISVAVFILLTACGGPRNIPTVFPSLTPEPSSTATASPTETPLPTLTPTPTITSIPFYQTEQVVFSYNIIGNHSVYDAFFVKNHPWSKIILYEDGQIIIYGKTYKQKMLSPDEVKQFFSKLETLGFYSLESNQKHDPTDKLYDYGNNYEESFDGLSYCVSVNTDKPRNLCVYEPDFQYVIQKMKNILQHLDEYKPTGMTPYYPDRMLVWVEVGRTPYDDSLPKVAIPWADHLPSLEASKGKIIYVDGKVAKEIYMLFDNAIMGKVFTQNGIEYTVHIEVILPHEGVTNAYQ